jgi:hypothetical protein
MLKRIRQKISSEEYLVGGSALPKVLLKVLEKIWNTRSSGLGNDRNLWEQ